MQNRWVRPLALLLVLAWPGAAGAAGRPSFGEYVRAARAIQEARLDEARVLLRELEKTAPDEPETRFLVGELAFLDGAYGEARAILESLDDARVREAVAELRPLVQSTDEATRGFARREFDHFVITYPPGKDEVLVELAGEALEVAYREIGADLGLHPTGKVRVEILPRITDLARVSTLTRKEIETSGTIALCKYNKIMIVSPRATLLGYPWLDTLAHEYAHFLISAITHERAPVWFHEGLAKFEESRWRTGPGGGGMGRLLEHLLAVALRRSRLISFDEMHPSLAKLPSQEAAATAFAEVYTLIAWLHGRIGYGGIRDVLARIADGRSARRSVAESLGRPWGQVEKAWKAHLRGLNLKPDAGRARRAGIRFRKGDTEDENLGIDAVAEEKARRHARLGGLLRARSRWAAAAQEYEKALVASGPDDPFVAGKLARTYLDLGETRRAIDVATPLVARADDDAYPHATLGAAWLRLGDVAQAVPHLLAAVRISPFDPAVRCGLAEAYGKLHDEPKAARERSACATLQRRAAPVPPAAPPDMTGGGRH